MLAINHALPAQSEQNDLVENTYQDYNESEYGCSQHPDDSMAAAYEEFSQTQSPDYSQSQHSSIAPQLNHVYVPTQILKAVENSDDEDDASELLVEERNRLHSLVGRGSFLHVYSVLIEKFAQNKSVLEGNILRNVFNRMTFKDAENRDKHENMVLKKDKKWHPKPWTTVSTRQKGDMERFFFDEEEAGLDAQILVLKEALKIKEQASKDRKAKTAATRSEAVRILSEHEFVVIGLTGKGGVMLVNRFIRFV